MDLTKKKTVQDWSLSDMPPDGHDDVGPFFHNLYLLGEAEKERLGLPERWRHNHRMFRGDHWGESSFAGRATAANTLSRLVMNLTFANIQRTIANLTAKEPVVEAIEVGSERGEEDNTDKDLTAWLKKWWMETNQNESLVDSATQMETYGPSIEKIILADGQPDTVVVDPYAFGKAPGMYDNIQDCPFVYHLGVLRTDEIERAYGLEKGDVEADDVYSIMGEDREDNAPVPSGVREASVDASGRQYVGGRYGTNSADQTKMESRALVIEVWCRDLSGRYDDDIRVVTLTNHGKLVLSDESNPNINWLRFREQPDLVANTYLFGNYPFNVAVSYRDKTTNWGFSAIEQTSDLNRVIDEVVSRFYAYIVKSMMPVLIVPKDTGVKPLQINNKPGLLLQPASSGQANSIRYMDPPRMSADVYQFINMLRGFFDQVWHIEDADRGEAPKGVIAAQAIQALQERNAVLMRAKIRAVDSIVEFRGKGAISLLQNFGMEPEYIKVNDNVKELVGYRLAGRDFDFSVETGSTVHKTTLQIQEQAVELYKLGAIDREALLANLNFPGWKSIIERVGESQLDQALQILVQAGMAPEMANVLKEELAQTQYGQPEGEGGMVA